MRANNISEGLAAALAAATPPLKSPSALATRAGITPTLLIYIRSGRRRLTPRVRASLAEALGIPEAAVAQLLAPKSEP